MLFNKVLNYSGNVACLVISFEDGIITSLNLYSPDQGTYDHFYVPINDVSPTFGLQNKEPQDHEEIHRAFGEMCSKDSEETKTYNTHFHWVGSANPQQSAILMTLMTKKIITRKDMPDLMIMSEAIA